MTTTSRTSELEAVNFILRAIGESPVMSLQLSGLLTLELARAALDESSRLIQLMGWSWNTEQDYPLSRDTSGAITIGSDVLKLDVNDEFNREFKPRLRGTRLYDAKSHSYSFSKDLKGTVTLLLPWDDLPEAARGLIKVSAARSLQGTSSVGESIYRYTERDEEKANLALQEQEAEDGDYNMLTDSYSCSSILNGGSW